MINDLPLQPALYNLRSVVPFQIEDLDNFKYDAQKIAITNIHIIREVLHNRKQKGINIQDMEFLLAQYQQHESTSALKYKKVEIIRC